ncbi:D-alanyl-D-alanine dipeptidase [Vibrio variabilis]|uniref:D-alanyl-D-alanine dipeptidase n=1 Tax=Vibrio variabilis TaxID=990271 RepID=A0ABQ0J7L7_9VIBR|nr:D-alanyl-D-alanine dipeptidase [Vibrio variabilis]
MLVTQKEILEIPSLDIPNWNVLEKINIIENGEPLVPISLSQEIVCYPAYYKMGLKYALNECFVRESVFEKLVQVTHALPPNIRLVVLDGWRPIKLQSHLFNTLLNQIRKSNEHEHKSERELINLARTFVSLPKKNKQSPSPHQTGGSVDVTLCDKEGRFLDMGSYFDEPGERSWTSAYECEPNLVQASNRRLLYQLMTDAGFTNLPVSGGITILEIKCGLTILMLIELNMELRDP